MYFNFKGFFRVIWLSLFHWQRTGVPMTWRKRVFLIGFFIIYPLVEITNAICFRLDWILFPSLWRTKVQRPVFIVGSPRSGTTRMHRLLALDQENFFCFKTWEIFFPSLLQKRFVAGLGAVDRLLGSPLMKAIRRRQERRFREFNKIHRLDLFAPEEDDKIHAHIFSFLGLMWFLPFREVFDQYEDFDRLLPQKDQARVMRYYRECIRRQACFRGGGNRQYLAKSPYSSLRVRSLFAAFPDCAVIALVRNPLEVLPSGMSIAMAAVGPLGLFPNLETMRATMCHCIRLIYQNVVSALDSADPHTYRWVQFTELTSQPARTVEEIYAHFGWPMSESFRTRLVAEDKNARGHRSENAYSLDQYGLDSNQITTEYRDIFDRFGFPRIPVSAGDADVSAVRQAPA